MDSAPSRSEPERTSDCIPPSNEVEPNHIDLALSGGGFRAALFHLGVVGYLVDRGWIDRVDNICSVSGGSVLAAYLVIHWDKVRDSKTFRKVAHDFAAWIMNNDVSGAVLRHSKWKRNFWPLDSDFLIREYGRILTHTQDGGKIHEVSWEKLRTFRDKRPHLSILATHANTGRAVAFSVDKVEIEPVQKTDRSYLQVEAFATFLSKLPYKSEPLARAVAASSAFPPFFSPVFPVGTDKTHFLTDGGVRDNSGIRFLMSRYSSGQINGTDRLVIASDAGRALPVTINQSYESAFEFGQRVLDALQDKIAREDAQRAEDFFLQRSIPTRLISIHDSIVEPPGAHSELVQALLAEIRTELDTFTAAEVFALYRHGYLTTKQKCPPKCDNCVSQWTPIDAPTPSGNSIELDSTQLEEELRRGRVVRKWGELRRRIIRLCSIACAAVVILLFAAGYWAGKQASNRQPPPPPSDTQGVVDSPTLAEVASNLAEPERKPFVENAVIKSAFHFPLDFQVVAMSTLFFECARPSADLDSQGMTLKVQVLIPSVDPKEKITVRPRTAPSTAGTGTKSRVFSWSNATGVRDWTSRAVDAGYEEFEGNVETDGAIVLVSYYQESVFAASTLKGYPKERRTGWIHVEVSDYAAKGEPRYYFAIGGSRQRKLSLAAYQLQQGELQPTLVQMDLSGRLDDNRVRSDWPPECKAAQRAVLEKLTDIDQGTVFSNGIQKVLAYFDVGMLDSFAGADTTFTGHAVGSARHDIAYIVSARDK